jgi:hypothetical protein
MLKTKDLFVMAKIFKKLELKDQLKLLMETTDKKVKNIEEAQKINKSPNYFSNCA